MTPTRRSFLSSLAVAPLAPRALLSWDAPATPPLAASPAAPGPEAAEVAKTLLAAVEARYGAQLEPGDLDAIRKALEDTLESARRLEAVPLGNGDEPVTRFSPRVEEGGAGGR